VIRRVFRRLFRIACWSALLVIVVGGLAGVAVWRELTMDLPKVTELLDYRPPTATSVLASDGTKIGEFYLERRYLIPIADVPEQVRQAFLAAEDAEFYRHPGIDFAGIVRASIANVQHGRVVQGASTITQQVVKQLLLTSERSFERKGKEMILAVELDSKLTKDEIFYLYLNHIYFGARSYGLVAAAREFFDVEPQKLTLAQAALLAGLPQAPSRYDPRRNPAAAHARQRYVLDRMLTAGFISPDQYRDARAEEVSVRADLAALEEEYLHREK